MSGSPRSGRWRFVAAACGFLLALGACSSGPGTGGGGKAGTGASGGGGASAGGPGGAVGNAGASGQSGGAAGSGGASSGGRSGAGGIAGAGAGGHGGAGGTTGGQGGAAGVCGAPAPPALPTGLVGPFACRGGWDTDASFASLAFDSADAIWGSAAGDIYVAGAAAGRGAIAHFDGAAWTRLGGVPAPNLPARYVTVWGTSANDVWAGGSSSVSRRVNQGAWTDASSGLPAGTNTRVVSLWGSGDAVFAAVDTQANASTFSAGIYQWSGTSWQRKSTPAVTGNFELRGVWGWSPGNFYVVGGKLDGSGKRTVPILWTYDGCAWSDQSNVLPPDTRELVAVNGTNGQVIVGGYFTGTTADKIGALEFITVGAFVRWDDVSPVGALMNRIDSVWIDVSGGALLGGAVETPIGTVAAGNARIGYGSGALTNAPIDGSAAVVTGFWNAPGSNQVWTITYSTAAPANIYLGTCQQYDPNNG